MRQMTSDNKDAERRMKRQDEVRRWGDVRSFVWIACGCVLAGGVQSVGRLRMSEGVRVGETTDRCTVDGLVETSWLFLWIWDWMFLRGSCFFVVSFLLHLRCDFCLEEWRCNDWHWHWNFSVLSIEKPRSTASLLCASRQWMRPSATLSCFTETKQSWIAAIICIHTLSYYSSR